MLNGFDIKPFETFDKPTDKVDRWYKYQLISDKKYDEWWDHFKHDIDYHWDHQLKNLFGQMFDWNPQTRISIGRIVKHRWYTKMLSEVFRFGDSSKYFRHSMNMTKNNILISNKKDGANKSQCVSTKYSQSVCQYIYLCFYAL